MASEASPFRSWEDRESFSIFPGVDLHAIGGEQVLLCRVDYKAGTTVERHSHEHTEQVMAVIEGEVEMTVDDQTRKLGPGDVVVVNRGREHRLHSDGGCTFFEALAPVVLDHVGDREGGKLHVER
jgi:quercetin dioxygenase-like cupin family protein